MVEVNIRKLNPETLFQSAAGSQKGVSSDYMTQTTRLVNQLSQRQQLKQTEQANNSQDNMSLIELELVMLSILR